MFQSRPPEMTAPSAATPAGAWGEHEVPLPPRPRRRVWTPATGLLLAVVLGAIGFLVGVRVEKGQLAGSPTAGSSLIAAARSGATRGAGLAGGGAGGGFARGFAGGAGGASGSFGTISSVGAGAVFLTDASGNTVKVTLNGATRITKSVNAGRRSLHPGDTVVVQGVKGPGGTIAAASVSDTGARASSGGGGAGGSSPGSAVNSLFGSGGG